MLYRAKTDKDLGVKGCKVTGKGDIFGYELTETFFVDNSGFGGEGIALDFDQFLNKVKAGYFYGIKEVGQFQVYIGEYKKLTRKNLQEKNPDIVSSKKVKNNTRLTIYKNGDKTLKLHSTDIIKWVGNKIILNSGGWDTMTTRARFNEFLGASGYNVFRKNGKTFVTISDKVAEFKDNMDIRDTLYKK